MAGFDPGKPPESVCTYKGKLYGLPYYTSYFGILYNDQMLKAAGFAGPPKTYDEWTQQARTIKKNGLSKAPMIWPVKWAGWGGLWVMNAMVASRGGKVLDESLNVTPVALDSLKWWAGTYKEGLSDPNGIELDPNESARAFMSGDYATMLTANFYAGAQWSNDKQNSKVAGYAKFGPTPELHKTVGFARLYGINSASSRKQDAWRLVKCSAVRTPRATTSLPNNGCSRERSHGGIVASKRTRR